MGSCASISGIFGSVVGTVGASETISIASAGTFALGASTIVAGKGEESEKSKLSSQVANDFIRATVARPSRSRSVVRIEKDRFDGISQKSLNKGKEFPVSHKQLRDSMDTVFYVSVKLFSAVDQCFASPTQS